jgi:hypothetical protein
MTIETAKVRTVRSYFFLTDFPSPQKTHPAYKVNKKGIDGTIY